MYCEDLFTLWNILHGSIVDAAGPGSNSLLLATGWMVDVALSYVVLPRSKAVSRVVASVTTVEADNARVAPAVSGVGRHRTGGGGGRAHYATCWGGRKTHCWC
jgi:hypothetical protein